MRMEHNPEAAGQMLADLDAVDEAFPDPPNIDDQLDVPAQVAARWQLAIAEAAARLARERGSERPSPEASEPPDDL